MMMPMRPVDIITIIGLVLNFLRTKKAMPAMATETKSVFSTPFSQKASVIIETPAEAIKATTTGRRAESTPWSWFNSWNR